MKFLNFNFTSLKTRILSSFLILIILMTLFIVYNYSQNIKMEAKADELINTQLEMTTANAEVSTSITVRAAAATNYALTGEQIYSDYFVINSKNADEYNETLLKLDPKSAEERQLIIEQTDKWVDAIHTNVFEKLDAGKKEEALENLDELNAEATVIRTQYDSLGNANTEKIAQLGNDVIDTTQTTKIVGLIISIIILILGVAIAILTARSISKPIQNISIRMKEISQGDLTGKIVNSTRKDEVGVLTTAVNMMTEQVKSILTSINSVSSTVASNSEELSQSALEVKQGTGQIAFTMQELSTGMETQTNRTNELAQVVSDFKTDVAKVMAVGKVVDSNSTEVVSLTNAGKGSMEKSSEQMIIIDSIMQSAVEKVEGLQSQSQEITQLVLVIKEIANQTNLLALNAAIEAARAGEHGKGFSVVADEVRKLAEQVQLSITNISSIVGRIQEETTSVTTSLQQGYDEVQLGTAQIQETNATFDDISKAVETMKVNIGDISVSLMGFSQNTTVINDNIQEVAALSEEVTAAVHETTATVEQTVSIIEEMASSNEYLAQSAEVLNSEVNQFKI